MTLSSASLEKIKEYKKELLALVEDAFLQRIISAYTFPNPVESMESELDKLLQEVLYEETKKPANPGI